MNRKRRILRSFAALLTACSLAAGMCCTAFAIEVPDLNDDGVIHYVSLGASQTNGYGLEGYLPEDVLNGSVSKAHGNVYGYQRSPEGSYPDLVKDTLEEAGYEVLHDQLAISSMRAEELRVLLDNDYYGDAYTEWRFTGGQGWFDKAEEGGLDALRDAYQSAVGEADLITVDIGLNNFGVYSINRIFDDDFASADFEDIFSGEDLVKFNEAKDRVMAILTELLGQDTASLERVEHIGTTLAYALTGFCVNFDASMERIYALNPDAGVVVVTIQNLLHGLKVSFPDLGVTLPLGDIYAAVIKVANLYTATGSPYSDRYAYANVSEDGRVEYFLDDIMVYEGGVESNVNLWNCFHLLDDTVNAQSAIQQMFAEMYGEELAAAGYTDPSAFFLAGLLGQLEGDALALYEDYLTALEAGYDTLARLAKVGANIDTLDMGALLDADNYAAAEAMLESYILADLQGAVLGALSADAGPFALDEAKYTADSACAAILSMMVRSGVGNSFFAHPNENGHRQIADAILTAVEEWTYGAEQIYNATHADYTITKDSYYVALGDTSATSDSYVDLLAAGLGVRYSNLANADVPIKTVLADNESEVAAADLITIGFSNNAVNQYMVEQVSDKERAPSDWSVFVGEEGAAYVEQIRDEINARIDQIGLGDSDSEYIKVIIDAYAYAYVDQLISLVATAEAVAAINDQAVIILVGQYNPMENVMLTLGEEPIALGDYIQYLVDAINAQAFLYAVDSGKVIYAEAPEVDTQWETADNYNPSWTMTRFIRNLNKTFMQTLNPSPGGHAYIKEQILSTLHVQSGYVVRLESANRTSARVSVANQTEETVSAVIILAVYDGSGRMIGCTTEEGLWPANETVEVSVRYSVGSGAETVKVFLAEAGTWQPLRTAWSSPV